MGKAVKNVLIIILSYKVGVNVPDKSDYRILIYPIDPIF